MRALVTRPMEWMSDAPVQVSASRHVNATAEEVFAVLADHERWPQWFTVLRSVEITGPAEGIGAQRRVTVRGLGALDEEFLAWAPGRAFGFSVTHMARPVFRTLNELVTIEAAEAGVHVTYQQAFEPQPWAPFMRLAAKRGMPKGLERGLEGLEKQISKGE